MNSEINGSFTQLHFGLIVRSTLFNSDPETQLGSPLSCSEGSVDDLLQFRTLDEALDPVPQGHSGELSSLRRDFAGLQKTVTTVSKAKGKGSKKKTVGSFCDSRRTGLVGTCQRQWLRF